MADTDKIKAGASEFDINKALKMIKFLGAGGTLSIVLMVGGAAKWVNDTIMATVKDSVEQTVRKEIEPLRDRMTRMELAMEWDRKARETK